MTLEKLDERRKIIKNKIIIGIDPANDKHQAFIIDEDRIAIGKSFSFGNNNEGITKTLWQQIKKKKIDPEKINPENIIFAIEASIDFWQILADYLSREGYRVALVSPLTTKKNRALPGNDFSRTDPKDSRMVAENTAEGYFHWYRHDTSREKAMKTLSLTYSKLRKDLQSNHGRLRSQVKRIFPELSQSITLTTKTATFLLSKYLYPQEYLEMDIEKTTIEIGKTSQKQNGLDTLIEIQNNAKNSIGIPKGFEEQIADKVTMTSITIMITALEKQLKEVSKQMIKFAKESESFNIITSIKGISDLTAAVFLAEIQNPHNYIHFKQIQKLAGLNLRLNTSGNSRSYYKINKIGNSRLRWVVYQMTKETAKHIPEVRMKYLKRQLHKSCYTKNIIACSSQLLQLLWCLIKNNRPYEHREEKERLLFDLEDQYKRKTQKYKKKKSKAKTWA